MIVTAFLLLAAAPPKKVEYANSGPVVVYALEENPKGNGDFPHQVFVALVRDGRESARDDVTPDLLGVDEGGFIEMTARINRFGDLFDVVIETVISGSGGISETSDFFYRIEGKELLRALRLKGTASSARGGVSYAQQTLSDVSVHNGQIVWIRRDRLAQAKKSGDPLVVHCRVTRKVYPIHTKFEGPLPRLSRREVVPCCAGCMLPP